MLLAAELPATLGQSTFPIAALNSDATRAVFELDVKPATKASHDEQDLVLEHMSLVRYVARSIHERLPQHVELDELISAGMVGLIDAVRKFDRSKQVQFKSYAQFRVRGAILDSLRSLDWSPRELRRKGRALAETTRALTSTLGHAPNDAEIAAEMGLSLRELQQLTSDLKGLEVGSLNEEHEYGAEETIAQVAAPITDDPFFQCVREQQREKVSAAIEELPEKERLVLTLYYFEELTMREIGLTLGVVESRVSQLRSSALARLRTALGTAPTSHRVAQRTTRAQAAFVGRPKASRVSADKRIRRL